MEPPEDEAGPARGPGELERALDGDPAALEALLTEHQGALRAFLRAGAGRRILHHEEVEDLAQSVCREILDHADRFRHARPDAFRLWLFREAHRKLLSRRRSLEAVRRDAEPLDLGTDPAALERLAAAYRSFTSPSHRMGLAEEVARVERALADLPEDQRTVVVLAHIAQWSRAEIGAELGRSEGAVRMLLHRALARLAVELA